MPKKNPKVDAYIAKVEGYAKPILKRMRAIVHKACPKAVEEMKWGNPFYLYQDRVLCATMGFKKHCAFIFWKGNLMGKEKGPKVKATLKSLRRIPSLDDLPSERELFTLIKFGMHYNEPTTKLPPRKQRTTPAKVPTYFMKALRANSKALTVFNAFSPSKKKDYIFWITSAKTDETRESRLETAIDWISEGKSRNWKYEASQSKKR